MDLEQLITTNMPMIKATLFKYEHSILVALR
jgi:hypothetical protein